MYLYIPPVCISLSLGPVKLDLPVKYEFGKNPKILDDKDPEWIMPDEYMVVLDPNTNSKLISSFCILNC